MARIFISYRRADSGASAGRLHDRLREHFGRDNIFMDIDTIEPGLDFTEAIEQTVALCDVLIALIGRQWLTSTDAAGQRRLDDPEDFVRREIATALRRNIRVIPALIQDTAMPRAVDLPDDLQPLTRRNAVELSDTHFHRDTDQLIAVLDRVLGATPSPALPAGTGPPHVPSPGRSSYLRSWRLWGLACLIFFACMAFIVARYVVPPTPIPPEPPVVPAPTPPQPLSEEVIEAGCSFSANQIKGEPGSTHIVSCPAGCSEGGSLWGTDVYTGDSGICKAAIHAGLIDPQGGRVGVILEKGRPAYRGSTRNKIKSSDYGEYSSSFRLARPQQ
jgi:LCCL domain-containing protein/TIR domain-containing protein